MATILLNPSCCCDKGCVYCFWAQKFITDPVTGLPVPISENERHCACKEILDSHGAIKTTGTLTLSPGAYSQSEMDITISDSSMLRGDIPNPSGTVDSLWATFSYAETSRIHLGKIILANPGGGSPIYLPVLDGIGILSERHMSFFGVVGGKVSITWDLDEDYTPFWYGLGVRSITYTSDGLANRCCAVYFELSGCNGHRFGGQYGHVTVWNDSTKESLVGTSTYEIENLGTVSPVVYIPESGDYYFEADYPGMETYSATQSFFCLWNAVSTISRVVSMAIPSAGRHCLDSATNMPYSVAETLYASHSNYGNFLIEWNESGPSGPGWYATVHHRYLGFGCYCLPLPRGETVEISIFIGLDGVYTETWNST